MVEVTRVEIVFGNVLKIMEVPVPELGTTLLTIVYEQFVITMNGNHIMYNLPVDHSVKMQVAYVDHAGNPAGIDGEVEWFTANPELATIEVDPEDGTICKVIPIKTGRTQVSARADADLGEGTRELLTVCDIMIVAGEAVAGSIQPASEPEPIEGNKINNALPGAQAKR